MRCNLIIADLDGVVYRGESPIAGAADAVEMIRRSGGKIAFLTNNASSTAAEYSDKLSNMGIEVSPGHILTSGIVAATYVHRTMGKSKAYLVGSEALAREMRREGIEVVSSDEAEVVVASFDREFTYHKLHEAMRAVRRGCPLIATNKDPTVPSESGFVPGAGSIVSAIEVASGVTALTVGKPSTHTKDVVEAKWGAAGRVCIVGDRLDTDIAAGNLYGWRSILVLSGSTGPSDLTGDLPEQHRPSAVYDNLYEFSMKEVIAR